MATQPAFDKPVSIEEYLSTEYEHDCEYVDGFVEERDEGEFDHAYVQDQLVGLFSQHCESWKVFALREVRVQTQPTHIRVPDVTVLREGAPREPILTHPPLLVIEVQPPEMAISRMAQRAIEYLAFGAEHVWVIDPANREAYCGTSTGLEPVASGELSIPGTPIHVSTHEIFARLDQV